MSCSTQCCCALFVASLFCIGQPAEATAADWPGFRGPNHAGISTDTKVPTEWGDDKNLEWKLKLPGAGSSSPIVVGKRVFVTCFTGRGNGLKRHLVCVDRETGKIEWQKAVPSTGPVIQGGFGRDHGQASHTPVSDGKNVYVMFGTTGAVAFDMTGKQLWKTEVGRGNNSRFGSAASPILYKDTLIVTAGNESTAIYGLNKKTGKQVWKATGDSLRGSYSTPVIAKNTNGDDQLLVSVTYETWGLNPETGKLKWYAETRVDTAACTSIVTSGTTAYIVGGRGGGRTALTISGKKGDVTKDAVKWSTSGGSYVSSPVLYKGHLYWTHNGIARCVDAKTGKEVGRKRLRGDFYASIALVNDKLYAVSRYNGTYVLEASPELKQLAHNKFSDSSDFSGSPAVSDGQLLIRSNNALYCISSK